MQSKFDPVRFALISVMFAGLAACGGGGDDSSPTAPPAPPPAPAPTPTPAPAPTPTPAPAPEPAPAPVAPEYLPFVQHGYATVLAGSTSTDPAVGCGRVDSAYGSQGRFGYRTNAMAAGPDGSIYLTDEPCDLSNGAYAVRKIEVSGKVSTVATGMAPIQKDYAGPLNSFVVANGIAVDANHNVFVSDARGVHNSLQDRTICHASGMGGVPPTFQPGQGPGIWKISPDGGRSIFAGVAMGTPGPVDGQGQSAGFTWPGSMGFAGDGTLFVMDDGTTQRYRKIAPNGQVTSVAGNYYYPMLTSSADGSVYAIGDCFPSAGLGADSFHLLNLTTGEKTDNALSASALLAVDQHGNAYSAFRGQGDSTSTIYFKRKGSSESAVAVSGVRDLRAIAAGADGHLYLKSGYAVLKISFEPEPEGVSPVARHGVVTHYAGSTDSNPQVACGRVDSLQPLQSKFGRQTSVMVAGSDGAIYLADTPTCASANPTYAIRKIDPTRGVTTVATSNVVGTILPGNFSLPLGLAIDSQKNIYVSDSLTGYVDGVMDLTCAMGEYGGRFSYESNVWKISPQGERSVFATGFFEPGPLGISGDGLIYVVSNSLKSPRVFNLQGQEQSSSAADARLQPNLVSSFSGDVYATTSCTDYGYRTTQLVDVRSGKTVADSVPNARLVAVDSRGNIYSTSSEAGSSSSAKSTVYRQAPNSKAFETVVTHVRDLNAIAVGPANELYIKSSHAIFRVDFQQ